MTLRNSQTRTHEVLIAPSLLSADFARLSEEVREVEEAGADWLHMDVMDGHFVPNITIGPLVVEALRPFTKLPLDCHLMVCAPDQWIEPFIRAGADSITVHAEASSHLDRTLSLIRKFRVKVGVSINPATPLTAIEEVLGKVDIVLIMSVNPGFGGQKFIESTVSKVKRLAEIRNNAGLKFLIEVDGGVNASNIGKLAKAGVDVFVAGKAVFAEEDRVKAIKLMRKAATK